MELSQNKSNKTLDQFLYYRMEKELFGGQTIQK